MIPLAGLSSLCLFHSQAGYPRGPKSRSHIRTPSIQRKKGIPFIDSLLKMRKLLFHTLPATGPLASDWGHRLISEPIPVSKWMLCPIWLRSKFLNLSVWKGQWTYTWSDLGWADNEMKIKVPLGMREGEGKKEQSVGMEVTCSLLLPCKTSFCHFIPSAFHGFCFLLFLALPWLLSAHAFNFSICH